MIYQSSILLCDCWLYCASWIVNVSFIFAFYFLINSWLSRVRKSVILHTCVCWYAIRFAEIIEHASKLCAKKVSCVFALFSLFFFFLSRCFVTWQSKLDLYMAPERHYCYRQVSHGAMLYVTHNKYEGVAKRTESRKIFHFVLPFLDPLYTRGKFNYSDRLSRYFWSISRWWCILSRRSTYRICVQWNMLCINIYTRYHCDASRVALSAAWLGYTKHSHHHTDTPYKL